MQVGQEGERSRHSLLFVQCGSEPGGMGSMRFANLLCVVLANNGWLFELANSALEVCGEKIEKKNTKCKRKPLCIQQVSTRNVVWKQRKRIKKYKENNKQKV